MTGSDYTSIDDPYCYPGSSVLKNKQGYQFQDALDVLERNVTRLKSELPLPAGHLDVAHYKAIHRHLFGDIFDWAGEFRTVRISKGRNTFCYPEYISLEMERLFAALPEVLNADYTAESFSRKSAQFLADFNAIHPFREGNGRTQLGFLALLCNQVGHGFDLSDFVPERILEAMIVSFDSSIEPLAAEIMRLNSAPTKVDQVT